eukprot:TRINITY_DN6940_c0_g1_i1.p1 TRINITY_DN6940_c0_g1~~TRINITY_DN6940_c0_g1_i1.p1  ORF type:complete len:375 (-),score=51.70 TRINITY_DN6940_c0_g1_i1:79-1128(-)
MSKTYPDLKSLLGILYELKAPYTRDFARAPFFHFFMNVSEAENLLTRVNKPGAYLLRFSSTLPKDIALSFMGLNCRISHVHIVLRRQGYETSNTLFRSISHMLRSNSESCKTFLHEVTVSHRVLPKPEIFRQKQSPLRHIPKEREIQRKAKDKDPEKEKFHMEDSIPSKSSSPIRPIQIPLCKLSEEDISGEHQTRERAITSFSNQVTNSMIPEVPRTPRETEGYSIFVARSTSKHRSEPRPIHKKEKKKRRPKTAGRVNHKKTIVENNNPSSDDESLYKSEKYNTPPDRPINHKYDDHSDTSITSEKERRDSQGKQTWPIFDFKDLEESPEETVLKPKRPKEYDANRN